MTILYVKDLAIPDVKIIGYERFCDKRGYFSETFRRTLDSVVDDEQMHWEWVQGNESFSRAGVVRGLHFQWNPYMGKLVRVIHGRMIDLVLDIRVGSPTFGMIVTHYMISRSGDQTNKWIWVPPGFAHGNLFLEDTIIEYLCTGRYNPECEAVISPYSDDINWSLVDRQAKRAIRLRLDRGETDGLVTDKDVNGLSVTQWAQDPRAAHFVYDSLRGQKDAQQ